VKKLGIFSFSLAAFFLTRAPLHAQSWPSIPPAISNWWSTISVTGRIIIVLIVLLFLVSALMIFYHILRFMWERKNLNRVEEHFRSPWLVTPELEKPEVCQRIVSGCSKKSIAYGQVHNLETITHRNPAFNYPDVAQLGYMKEASRRSLNIVKFSRANLVVLGLLGTFWGLSLLVGDIDSVFATIDSSNVKALLDSFRKATDEMAHIITPMQTAFSTSLAGLLGTLLLSFFMAGLDRTRKHFFTRLETFLVTRLVPLLTDKDEAGIVADLKTAARKLDDASVRLSGIAAKTAANMGSAEQIVNGFRASTEGIIKSQENLLAVMENIEPMIREARENSRITREESSRLLTGLDGHLKRMDDVTRRFKDLGMNFDEWLSQTITPFHKQQQDFTRILQANADENKNTLSQLGNDIARHHETVNNTFKQLLETHETFVKDSARDYGENMKTAVADVLQGFQRYEDAMMDIAGKLNAVAGDLENVTRRRRDPEPSGTYFENSQKNLDSIKGTLENMFVISEKNHRSLNAIVEEVSGLKNNGGDGRKTPIDTSRFVRVPM
jgi:hypothetical protein